MKSQIGSKRGVKTEVHSIQASSQKPNLLLKQVKKTQEVGNSIGIMASLDGSDIETKNLVKEKLKRSDSSIKLNRKYSLVIAENILESPNERDHRDNKNNNIWGIRELDVRDKPEHIFDDGD